MGDKVETSNFEGGQIFHQSLGTSENFGTFERKTVRE